MELLLLLAGWLVTLLISYMVIKFAVKHGIDESITRMKIEDIREMIHMELFEEDEDES